MALIAAIVAIIVQGIRISTKKNLLEELKRKYAELEAEKDRFNEDYISIVNDNMSLSMRVEELEKEKMDIINRWYAGRKRGSDGKFQKTEKK